jgi:hypothetical protein
VIESSIPAGPFDGIEGARLLDYEDLGSIPFGIAAKFTEVAFGNIPALDAEGHAVLDGSNGIRQPQSVVPFCLQQMKCQPLCAFLTNPGQPNEFSRQPGEQPLLIDAH